MSHYQLMLDDSLLCDEFTHFLSLEANSLASWNNGRYGYIANLALERLKKSENKLWFVNLALEYPSSNKSTISVANRRILTEPLLGQNYPGAGCASATLRTIICLIEIHLACRRVLRFNPSYQQNFNISKGFIDKSALFNALPDLPKCLLLMSTPRSVIRYKSIIPEKWLESYDKNISRLNTYKNQAASIAAYRRLSFTLGLSDFLLLDNQKVESFRTVDTNPSNRCYLNAIQFFRDLGATGLTYEGVASTRVSQTVKSKRAKQHLSKYEHYLKIDRDINYERLISDNYHLVSGKTAIKMSGIKNVLISVKRTTRNKVIKIDDYVFEGKWSSYSCNNLTGMNSPWVRSQQEYLKSIQETSTKKNVSAGLQVLNVYLFHYLKYFFEQNDVPYPYPNNISDFKHTIYIAPSDIVNEHIYDAIDIEFPVSLIDWIKLAHTNCEDSVTKARSDVITKYFDFIVFKYAGVTYYSLESNPFSFFDKKRIRGKGYSRSNKKLFDLEYWKLFTEFLYVISDSILDNIEQRRPAPRTGLFSLKINKSIEFADLTINVDSLDDLAFPRAYIGREAYIRPQIILAFLVMAQTGLRMANVMNLDLRSYDRNFDSSTSYQDADSIELFVNTDKARLSRFWSDLPFRAFKLLKRFEAIRGGIAGVPITPSYYNQSEETKWGEVLPLLAVNSKNTYDGTLMPALLHAFEIQLRKAGVNLGSEVFYKPIFLDPREFFGLRKRKQRTPSDNYCVHYESGESAYFTPIEISSFVTPHSFRKTVDSYISVLIGDENTGKFLTGQTAATVGYYREVTPQSWKKLMSHIEDIDIPSGIPLKLVSKQEDDLRSKIITEGLKGINGFTLSAIDENINVQLSTLNPSDIAVNHTHICIYGNDCPPDILSSFDGKKNCALCPVSIGTPHDGVAIVAQIKYHLDNISEINEHLESNNLTHSERRSFLKRRSDELNFACSWSVRHKFIMDSFEKDNNYCVLDDGKNRVKTKLEYVMPSTNGEELYSRLIETKFAPSLQSEKLKLSARRLVRKLLSRLDKGEVDLPEIKPIEMALSLMKKIVELHGISNKELEKLLEESAGYQKLPFDELLSLVSSDGR